MGGNIFKIINKFLFPDKNKMVAKLNNIMRCYEETAPAMQFPLVVGHQCCVATQKGIMISEDTSSSRNIKKFCRMWIPLTQALPKKRNPSSRTSPTTGFCAWTSPKWNDVPAEGSKPETAADLSKTETLDNKKLLTRSIGTCTNGQMSSVGCQYKDKSCQISENLTVDRTWNWEYCPLNSSCVGSSTYDLRSDVVCQYNGYRHNKRCQTSARLTGIRSQEPGTSRQYHIAYPMTLADLRIKQRKIDLLLYAKETF